MDETTNFDNSSLPLAHGMGASPSRTSDINQSKTFKTELPEDQQDPKELPKECRDLNLQINEKIDRLDGRFAQQLRTHSTDFINAYMGHMTKVRKELKYLKNEQDKVNSGLMNDDRITNL